MLILILPDIAEEDRLLSRAHRGQDDALRQIYSRYYVPVYQFIRLRTDDAGTAEDLAADVFVRLVDAFRRGKGPRSSLRGWLFRVARHTLYDHYHAEPAFVEAAFTGTDLDDWLAIPPEDEPEAQFVRSIRAETARRAIQQLTLDQQEVVILRFGHMLSLQETADIMGKQVNAVKQLQLRALESLRRALIRMGVSDD